MESSICQLNVWFLIVGMRTPKMMSDGTHSKLTVALHICLFNAAALPTNQPV
jgi:hypothetical protein